MATTCILFMFFVFRETRASTGCVALLSCGCNSAIHTSNTLRLSFSTKQQMFKSSAVRLHPEMHCVVVVMMMTVKDSVQAVSDKVITGL